MLGNPMFFVIFQGGNDQLMYLPHLFPGQAVEHTFTCN